MTASKEVYTQRLHNKNGHVDKQLFLKIEEVNFKQIFILDLINSVS